MRSLPTPAPAAARQLSMPFDTGTLHGMSRTERSQSLARMARLLLEAAGASVEEYSDDER
ncbi:MAG: hypothetical protein HWD60_03445 [Defluviicoccus sp.]|nr:MAG: hypothetical protein HWD60_03445 [Defluviicoccus sp.]